jgi:hypothetical protein
VPLTLVQTVAPTAEPLTLAEAKLHARQDFDDDDTLFTALIVAARNWAETYTGRQLVTATWRLSTDQFPYFEGSGGRGLAFTAGLPGYSPFAAYASYGAIRLPRPPLQSVTSIVYDDTTGTPQTLDPTLYRVDADSEPARITPAYGEIWPTARAQTNAVRVTYTAGHGNAAAVPQAIKQALLLMIGHWYVNREAVAAEGVQAVPLPLAVNSLLDPYRSLWEF